MNIVLVQGTWGDNDSWWLPGRSGNFYEGLTKAGHTVVNGRLFEWDCALGGIGVGERDLNGWKFAGQHLYDYLDPPQAVGGSKVDFSNLCIIAHSHGRQVVKYAHKAGLRSAVVILMSGPIRKDVDAATAGWKANTGRLVCLNGGKRDYWQILGELCDGHIGPRRTDPEADIHLSFSDATHSSMLNDPAQFSRVLAEIHH